MSSMGDIWMGMGTLMGGVMFVYTMIQQFVPRRVADYLLVYVYRITAYANPYMEISFDEFVGGERVKLSEAYTAVEAYLAPKSSKLAKRLKAQIVQGNKDLALSMADHEEIFDDFGGVKIWWYLGKTTQESKGFSYYPSATEKRHLKLQFHRRYRETVTKSYLNHVIKVGKESMIENRHIRLYSNNPNRGYQWSKSLWSHVEFEHPVTFHHIAMNPEKKQEIIDDLETFRMGKDYYLQIGKPWKRGYLLYGPPGTGKSSMIASMAKLLNYDIYDLELTAVKDNSELRNLLHDTSNKSITVIEDVDCSLNLTGKRKKKKKKDDKDEKDPVKEKEDEEEEEEKSDSKVTLSGLLNVIDGLWSACGKERIIVFTTNYVEKLDPALIRSGRMDKHIEMSYCCYEGFKVFAKNYLNLDSHELFDTIRRLMGEVKVSPADVAENLMPKTIKRDSQLCLKNLIKALEKIKVDEKLKAEEEEAKKLKDEKEAIKLKAEEQEDARKLKAEEEEDARKLKAEEEEDERRLKAEEEEDARRLKAEKEEDARKSKAEEEEDEKRLKAEEEEDARMLKAEEEEDARMLKAEEEEDAKRLKAEEEEDARMLKAEEEEDARKLKAEEEEDTRMLKAEEEEDARRLKAEEEEDARKLKAEEEEDVRKLKAEEEDTRKLKAEEEKDARRLKAEEEEDARMLKAEEEEDARKLEDEEEDARMLKAEEEEDARELKAEEEEEARKIKAEEEQKSC